MNKLALKETFSIILMDSWFSNEQAYLIADAIFDNFPEDAISLPNGMDRKNVVAALDGIIGATKAIKAYLPIPTPEDYLLVCSQCGTLTLPPKNPDISEMLHDVEFCPLCQEHVMAQFQKTYKWKRGL
jgi:hypothetical protein